MKKFENFLFEQDELELKNAFSPIIEFIGNSNLDKSMKRKYTKQVWDLMNKILREVRNVT